MIGRAVMMGVRSYEPGTVAEIRWPMTSGAERALFDGEAWRTESGVCVKKPTDIRPLVILDPNEANSAAPPALVLAHLVELLRADESYMASSGLADQIEAQTKPPRIDEPGLWGVVRESSGRELVRNSTVLARRWVDLETGNTFGWDEIQDDPTLIREGVAA